MCPCNTSIKVSVITKELTLFSLCRYIPRGIAMPMTIWNTDSYFHGKIIIVNNNR
jgi:hypothetical protein